MGKTDALRRDVDARFSLTNYVRACGNGHRTLVADAPDELSSLLHKP